MSFRMSIHLGVRVARTGRAGSAHDGRSGDHATWYDLTGRWFGYAYTSCRGRSRGKVGLHLGDPTDGPDRS